MPKARAPNAPWVEVWLSPQTIVMPGWVMPCSGPMTWTIPWRGSSRPYRVIPCRFAVGDERFDLLAGEWVADAVLAADGGDPVVDGGQGEVGPADTGRPVSRRPSKACGEVTSWTRCRSMYSRSGSPGALRTT